MALTPTLCAGRDAATGDCFVGGPADQTSVLKVGNCVHVTFKPHASNDPPGSLQLVSIKSASAGDHRDDCPGASAVFRNRLAAVIPSEP